MAPPSADPTTVCHVVAMPYPGRGHINPMMNLCKLISNRRPEILITFIVTEEWLGFLSSEPAPPATIRLSTIPNVIPSEIGRGNDFRAFYEATYTKMEAPVEELLERLELPKPSVIIYDSYLPWVVGLGNRRNIPVASFYTMSATVFSIFHHFDILIQNGHFQVNPSERGQERVSYIPGVSSTRVVDLPTPVYGKGQDVLPLALEAISLASKAQYLLFTSVYELEAEAIDALKENILIPLYSIGPAIPYLNARCSSVNATVDPNEPEYIQWLDAQPKDSVLYISQGSFLSVSSPQLDEIVAGVHDSGVRFFWVARGETSRFRSNGGKGMVVPWCDQLRVLSHSSVGGFWSHCGWNSTKEAIFAGLPMLTFPIFWDQVNNSKRIVEDWKIGLKVRRDDDGLISREEIARILQKFMDSESDERKEMKRRASDLQEICEGAIAKGGSSETNIDAFLEKVISHTSHNHH